MNVPPDPEAQSTTATFIGCVTKNMLGHKNTERHFSSGGNIEEMVVYQK